MNIVDLRVYVYVLFHLILRKSNALTKHNFRLEDILKEQKFDISVNLPTVYYDKIVVGGGAAGCPLARTLAETNQSVLLIERGGSRKNHPLTQDIFGAGRGIHEPDISQLIITQQGIRTHVGSVLSGGTAINLAIQINEKKEYFDYLSSLPGSNYDFTMFSQAMDWVNIRVNHYMPDTKRFGPIWRRLLEVWGPNRGYSDILSLNTSWRGTSLFDDTNNWYRNAADILLGDPLYDMPKSLDILLQHTVHKIEFEKVKDKKPQAKCVIFARSRPEDSSTISSRAGTVLGIPIRGIRNLFNSLLGTASPLIQFRRNKSKKLSVKDLRRACIKQNGEIILSTGALMTPLLLFKSGIGPREQIDRLNIPLISEEPLLGTSMTDRVFIPVSTFFKGKLEPSGFEPRICESLGIRNEGASCNSDNFSTTTNNQCSIIPAEHLQGGRLPEGIIYATRFIFPPERRNDLIVDYLLTIFENCANGMMPFNSKLYEPFCRISRNAYNCFRKVSAYVFFASQPKSTGNIHVSSRGEIVLNGNYLTHPDDIRDAIKGVSAIIKAANSTGFEGIMEPPGVNSCPAQILNTFLKLITNIDMATRDIMPQQDFRFMNNFIRNWLALNPRTATFPIERAIQRPGDFPVLHRCYRWGQNYATYPIALPNPEDDECVKNYALSWMTSMWHWIGSAKMGEIVDDHFRMFNVDGLSIVDASVISNLTRMNPTATLLALGRYAGLLKNRELQARN